MNDKHVDVSYMFVSFAIQHTGIFDDGLFKESNSFHVWLKLEC